VGSGEFVRAPRQLFALRIELAEIATEAVQLELQASGGKAYLGAGGGGFARRWREAAFVPIVTPSLVQLKSELASAQADSHATPDHEAAAPRAQTQSGAQPQ